MKRTLSLLLLSSILSAGQALGASATTQIENAEIVEGYYSYYAGGYDDDEGDVSGHTDVLVKEGEETLSGNRIVGGFVNYGKAYGNQVTMIDGTVMFIEGAYSRGAGTVHDNAAVMTGGKSSSAVYGGMTESGDASGNFVFFGGEAETANINGARASVHADDNTVVVTGGKVTATIYGGYGAGVEGAADNNQVYITNVADNQGGQQPEVYAAEGHACTNNELHLIGLGACLTGKGAVLENGQIVLQTGEGLNVVAGGQHDPGSASYDANTGIASFEGNSFNLKRSSAGGKSSATAATNEINIYGYGMHGGVLQSADQLNFNLVDALLTTDKPIMTLDSVSGIGSPLFTFNALEAMSWQVGDTITLFTCTTSMKNAFGEVTGSEHVYNVTYQGTEAVIATGYMELLNNSRELVFHVGSVTPPPIPEPATGTLSLLALCALAARRRK